MHRFFLVLLTALLLGPSCAPREPKGPVILAASSLQAPLEQLAAQWTASGRPAPVLSFASSAALARQISEGAQADIFVSADRRWTEYLAAQSDLARWDLRVIAANRLVLARRRDRDASPDSALASLGTELLATGDPETVPLGRYAREALLAEDMWDRARPTLVGTSSAHAATVLVRRGEASLGVLYASDVEQDDTLEVLREFPASSHSPIEYVAVLLPASAHPDAAGFLDYIASREGRQVFASHGFRLP